MFWDEVKWIVSHLCIRVCFPKRKRRYFNATLLKICSNWKKEDEERCDLKAQKMHCCLVVILAVITPAINTISAFRLDSDAHCSHSVTINSSRTFQQFSQMSCTIINKPVDNHKLRVNILEVLVTATSVSLTWLLMHLNVVYMQGIHLWCYFIHLIWGIWNTAILSWTIDACKVLKYWGKIKDKTIFPRNH